MKKLNLNEFFYELEDTPYVLVKKGENFPEYHIGQDADIFCYDKQEVVAKILSVGNNYFSDGYIVKTEEISTDHCQVDFEYNDALIFKFDIYVSLPDYEKLSIKKHYFYSIIEGAVGVKSSFGKNNYYFYVPSLIDDLLIRYFEYLEYYEQRPDKLKHLKYIVDKIKKGGKKRIDFFDKLHLYTNLPGKNESLSGYEKKIKINKSLYWLIPVIKKLESVKIAVRNIFHKIRI